MTVTMADVRAALTKEEPDYGQAMMLGPEALPHLKEIVSNSDNALLASKAAFLATIIPHQSALDVVKAAVSRSEPEVRVAAAAGVKNLMGSAADQIDVDARAAFQRGASELLVPMLTDPDSGVRKAAERSLQADKTVEAVSALRDIANTVPDSARAMFDASLKKTEE